MPDVRAKFVGPEATSCAAIDDQRASGRTGEEKRERER